MGFLVLLVVVPLLVFAPAINEAKRRASREYGRLAQRYAIDFEGRWLPGGAPAADTPLGTGDIQSLADMANSLETVRQTRAIPVTKDALVKLAVAVLAPISPLVLTVIPAEEIFSRLLKILV